MNTISMSTNSSEDPRAEKSRPDRDAGDRGLMPIWRL
jgi:hypothetical protein